MGKISKNVAQAHWITRISLILLFSVAYTAFMDGGLSNPQKVHATVAITQCSDCHGNPPADGTRSGATGSFLGSHNKHSGTGAGQSGLACSVCHAQPTAPNWEAF